MSRSLVNILGATKKSSLGTGSLIIAKIFTSLKCRVLKAGFLIPNPVYFSCHHNSHRVLFFQLTVKFLDNLVAFCSGHTEIVAYGGNIYEQCFSFVFHNHSSFHVMFCIYRYIFMSVFIYYYIVFGLSIYFIIFFSIFTLFFLILMIKYDYELKLIGCD